ncbi:MULTISPECIES: ABC transporter substrate-binding protein [unclassified Bradyrhizobium]|uniref:ABC transporter substrate-binding protein n=1 Tax=unclassified Bradyrhizobium TaxID=2631580 RepID=UPI0003A83576|nr:MULTISPECIES: ABC transporter substrate-binding protein [unclassified Bradyrhizobium]MCK1323868.1 ABC transporter substrate-binding protein [Bradyrhizobium sp. 156]MCK1354912.1 ABC transporter substrate-binding protein [Bradyrhizobium sp. CW7]MCK1411925.1 ABC transporter substrate-binding protein [Bradyrhizobium sp. CW4]MCK1502109.1 ABC transporter substrate-binding protein [Bradyrhizobium sp. 188]MCK1563543.1 ABC transporter substrate-binding protein [Bradyrhizobium sp. 173]
MAHFTRRNFLAASAASSLTLPSAIRHAFAAANIRVRWASLQPGFTVLPVQYILANDLGGKNGLSFPDPAPYTAVSTYYNDFVAGNYDVCIGSWDTFAARYQAGVPIRYLCTITDANMIALLGAKGGVDHVSQLKGKTIAALQSTGTYRMVKALINEAFGFDIEKDATIQNVDNPAASVTLLMADRADAALSWEPNITTGLMKKPDLRVILKAGDAYKRLSGGLELPYFGVAIRKELADANPGIAAKVSKVFEDCLSGINADTAKAVDLFGSKTGVAPDALKEAMGSKRLTFNYRPMSDELSRSAILLASDFLARNGLLTKPVDANFFAV